MAHQGKLVKPCSSFYFAYNELGTLSFLRSNLFGFSCNVA
jgi:hypothetical protein